MKKSDKNVLWIVVLVMLLAVGGDYLQGKEFNLSGYAPISMSLVDYISYDSDLAGKAWLLTVSLNGNGQYALAQRTFSADEIKDVNDAKKASGSLTIKAETSPMTCQYSIDNRNKAEIIYALNYEMHNSLTEAITHTFENKCKTYADSYYFYKKPSSYDYYCFRATMKGTHGVLNTPSTIWSAKLTATKADGTSESKTLSSWGVQNAWLGNNVYASWVGDFVGPEQCPVSNIPDATFIGGSWVTTDHADWVSYNDYAQASGGFATCLNIYSDPDRCQNDFNIKATYALSSKALTMYTAEGTYASSNGGTNMDGGQVNLVVDKLLRNPVITFKIKESWYPSVSIVQEAGIPDILSATNVEFTTGSSGITNVQVKNIGSGTGTFDYYASCTSGLSQSGKSPDKLQVLVGQTALGQLYITGSASQDTTGSCTINVYDVNNANSKDSTTIIAKIKTICESTDPVGMKKCSGNTIVQSDGCRYNIYESCNSGCEYKSGLPQCKTSSGTNNTSCTPSWQTSQWSECMDGIQTRTTTDTNNCGSVVGMPVITKSCGVQGEINYVLSGAGLLILAYALFGMKNKR